MKTTSNSSDADTVVIPERVVSALKVTSNPSDADTVVIPERVVSALKVASKPLSDADTVVIPDRVVSNVKVTSRTSDADMAVRWFVMRDLKRANAKSPTYKLIEDTSLRVFTPMTWRLFTERGRRVRREVPAIPDLLFVRGCRERLDPIVAKTATLQYRWLRNTWREPMTVPDAAMERFIQAVSASDSPRFYLPDEITPSMQGRQIRIVGGPLDGCEGKLVTTRGSKHRRLLIELPQLLAVSVEVTPDYVQVVE